MIDDTMLATLAAVGSPGRWPPASPTGSAVWSTGWASTRRTRSPRTPSASWSMRWPARRRPRHERAPPEPAGTYDEFSLFEENAVEAGLPWIGPARRATRVGRRGRRAAGSAPWSGDRHRPALVLLHGGGQNAHTWDTVALALDRPLVAVDLPGHGHSDWPGDCRALDPGAMAEDVATAMTGWPPTPAGGGHVPRRA